MGGYINLGQLAGGPEATGRAQEEAIESHTGYNIVLQLPYILIKRLPLRGTPPFGQWWKFAPGHYWIEIHPKGDPTHKESYGWYPARPVAWDPLIDKPEEMIGLRDADVPGIINGASVARQAIEVRIKNKLKPGEEHAAGGGIGFMPFPWDPHHGNHAESVSNPWVGATRTQEDIIDQIRTFAAEYKKTSNGLWTFWDDIPGENNCHTFIWKLLAECDLADFNLLNSWTDPHFARIDPPGLSHPNGTGWMNDLRERTERVRKIVEDQSR